MGKVVIVIQHPNADTTKIAKIVVDSKALSDLEFCLHANLYDGIEPTILVAPEWQYSGHDPDEYLRDSSFQDEE